MICLPTKSHAACHYRFLRIGMKLTGEEKFRTFGLLVFYFLLKKKNLVVEWIVYVMAAHVGLSVSAKHRLTFVFRWEKQSLREVGHHFYVILWLGTSGGTLLSFHPYRTNVENRVSS